MTEDHQDLVLHEGNDIAEVEEGGMMPMGLSPVSSLDKIEAAIQAVEKLGELSKQVRKVALTSTKPQDWRQWGDKLRMEESGASAIIRTFGITYTRPDKEIEARPDGVYTVYHYSTFTFPITGAKTEAVGTCMSNDDIVATRYEYVNGKRQKMDIPPDMVDKATVIKKSLANMKVNGVASLLGLKNVTKGELEQLGIVVSTKDVSHSKKAWEMSDGQKSMLKKFKATAEEIAACKSNADVTNLVNAKKEGMKKGTKASAAKGSSPSPSPTPEAEEATPGEDAPAPVKLVNQLVRTVQSAGKKWEDMNEFRQKVFSKGEDDPWMESEIKHAQKWLISDMSAAEYANTIW